MDKVIRVCTFLADGFETVEALAVVDILRRTGIKVELISISDKKEVISAHNIKVTAEKLLDETDFDDADVLFLPGGSGHTKFFENEKLAKIVKQHNEKGKIIAAICAAPSYLGELGILKGKKATCFPGFEEKLNCSEVLKAPIGVVVDGNIVTARGMGKSIDLGLELVKLLISEDEAQKTGMVIQYLED